VIGDGYPLILEYFRSLDVALEMSLILSSDGAHFFVGLRQSFPAQHGELLSHDPAILQTVTIDRSLRPPQPECNESQLAAEFLAPIDPQSFRWRTHAGRRDIIGAGGIRQKHSPDHVIMTGELSLAVGGDQIIVFAVFVPIQFDDQQRVIAIDAPIDRRLNRVDDLLRVAGLYRKPQRRQEEPPPEGH
jgi:hypothetical protein